MSRTITRLTADRVVTGVSGHSVIIKNIVLPPMSQDELEESIDWHAEEHIPYDLSDVSLDYQVTAETPDATYVLIAACKRERIDNIKQAIQLAGKTPVVIDVDTFALQNCYEINYQPDDSQVVTLLNIGASTMNVNIVKGNRSLFTPRHHGRRKPVYRRPAEKPRAQFPASRSRQTRRERCGRGDRGKSDRASYE